MADDIQDGKFEALLGFINRSRGVDFSGYKRPNLMRRVLRRMQAVSMTDFEDYRDYLEVHPDEFIHLFNTILINVTGFFRDEGTWDVLARQLLPDLLGRKAASDEIRVWSAGCASGEEAYTAAIVLAEALGVEAFQARVKIYATDVDEDALRQARQGSYSAKDLEPVVPAHRDKYFEAANANARYVFRPDLRRAIIFGNHNLHRDAPISRLDLLICRNTLMYFNAEAQTRILTRFHFALNDPGLLMLGKAELLLTQAQLFTPVTMKHRIFAKAGTTLPRERLFELAENGIVRATQAASLRDLAFQLSTVAQLVVDSNGRLEAANDRARSLFGVVPKDLGRPFHDLEISYRPADLRTPIDQAFRELRLVALNEVERHLPGGEVQFMDVQAIPIRDEAGRVIGVSVVFHDITARHNLQVELQKSSQELETAYEELQSAHEELEATNEELQSTNEELETTNEELQSSNEELETMNEEIQSTNQELETINDELRQRNEQIDTTAAFMAAIFTSLQSALIVADHQLGVLAWNRQAEDLWGLREEEVRGRSLLNLDIGLPVEQLPLRALLTGRTDHEEIDVDAMNRRGKAVRCHVVCTPYTDRQGERRGVVLLIDEREAA
jgi:two-component system CheB/CheR fusion protein